MDDRAVGYAVWLIPDSNTLSTIQKQITELCNRCNTPSFPAHITLLSSLKGPEDELINATKTLAENIEPIPVSLTRAGYRESYFRNLYVNVAVTDELRQIREKAFHIFNHEELKNKTFMPHVSLLYGYLAAEEKERILMDMGHEFNMTGTITSLKLIKTEGRVKEWKEIYNTDIANS